MKLEKDILSLPRKAFFYKHPYSLMLSEATITEYEELYKQTEGGYSTTVTKDLDYGCGKLYHFSRFSCFTNRFEKTKVLTVNRQTGNWCWRIPYSRGTYPV